jgi:NAD(P)-dependent dehydrogenase (short-subunit alcohol dehydrogenase family)
VAIVTGGGRGVGRAAAQALARRGAAVAVTARTGAELDAAARAVEAAGGRALAVPADTVDDAAVAETVRVVEARLGPVGTLVCAAGVNEPVGPLWETDQQVWWRTVTVNLRGPVLWAHAVLPGMVERRGGVIVNVASDVGLRPMAHFSAYAVSKTALIRLTECVALEAAPHGVEVYAVHPGMMLSRMNEHLCTDPTVERFYPGMVEAFRAGKIAFDTPERAGEVIEVLAAGEARGLSGRYIDVKRDDLAGLRAQAEALRRAERRLLRMPL